MGSGFRSLEQIETCQPRSSVNFGWEANLSGQSMKTATRPTLLDMKFFSATQLSDQTKCIMHRSKLFSPVERMATVLLFLTLLEDLLRVPSCVLIALVWVFPNCKVIWLKPKIADLLSFKL